MPGTCQAPDRPPGPWRKRPRALEDQAPVGQPAPHADPVVDVDRGRVVRAHEQADGGRALEQPPAQVSHPALSVAEAAGLGIDPLQRDREGFRWRTQAQIGEGRSWIWLDGDTILFKAEASAWTPQAVQWQQVWVDPSVRGRGFGSRGMRDLCRGLLERTPTVCLFVRADNEAGIRTYESIGMRRTISYRSLIF